MEDITEKDIDHVKQLVFSDTPELAFKMLTNWDKTLVSRHFEIECAMFPFLCLQYLPFLLDGFDKFNLEDRRLTALPPQIGELKYLKTLILHDNMLRKLPGEISRLKHLSHLDLGFNFFEEFPPQLGELTNLYVLTLEHNKLTSLLPAIGSLTNLISLDLSDNQITRFPEEIKQLTRLQSLEVINNPLPKSEIEKLKTWLPNCEINYS